MSILPLKVSSLQTKEIHIQNKLVFSNPTVALTGSSTALLFSRLDTLETEVGDLYANGGGGGGGGGASLVAYPITVADTFEDITSHLLLGQPLGTDPYDTFARFKYPSTSSPLLTQVYSLPNAVTGTHFRISNETDLEVFPFTTALVVESTNTDNTTNLVSMTTEVVSFRHTNGTWSFYSSA